MSQILEEPIDPGRYTNGVFDASDNNEVDMTWSSWARGTGQSKHVLLTFYWDSFVAFLDRSLLERPILNSQAIVNLENSLHSEYYTSKLPDTY
jgi:hypothetical protein